MAEQNATAGMPPIGVDPAQWYAMQRRMLQAQMLTQQAFTPVQENNYGPMRSRLSPLQPLAQLAAAYMSRKKMAQLAPEQARMYQQQMVPFGGGQPADPSQQPDQGQPASPPPAAQASSPGAGAGGGAPSPAPAGAAPGAGTDPAGMAPSSGPLNPMGMPPALAMRMFLTDPGKYGELIAGPNDWRTAVMASGGDTRQAGRLLLGKLQKEGMIDVRPGGMVIGKSADGTPFMIRNPSLPEGAEPDFGPNWQIIGAHTIPGAPAAITAAEQAKETGKEQGSMHELHTRGGGTGYVFGVPSSVPGAPGGGPSGGGGAAPPQFFPPAGAHAGTDPNAVGPGAGGHNDPWQTVPQLKVPQGFGESDAYTQAIVHKAADKHVELSDKFGEEADLADARIAFNNEALKLLNGNSVEVGPLSDRLVKLAKMATEAGIDPKNVPWLPSTEVANNTDELKKFFLRNPLLNLKPTFGGRPAAAEFQVLRTEASPNENMLAAASRKLLEVDNTQAQFTKQRAQAYDRYHDMGGNPLRFQQWYSSRFPFSQVLDKARSGDQVTAAQAAAELARRKATSAPLSQAP